MTGKRGEVFSDDTTINYWKNRNGTNSTANTISIPNTNSNDGSSVKKNIYINGLYNTEVVLYKITG